MEAQQAVIVKAEHNWVKIAGVTTVIGGLGYYLYKKYGKENIPEIRDVLKLIDILKSLGVEVERIARIGRSDRIVAVDNGDPGYSQGPLSTDWTVTNGVGYGTPSDVASVPAGVGSKTATFFT